MPIKKQLKAFTIIELLVSMTLTGILVTFAFLGYNQMQKLFINYTQQSEFISEYNQLNKALFVLADKAQTIKKENDHSILFKTDTNTVNFEFNDKNCLLKFASRTDTFHFELKEPVVEYILLNNNTVTNVITIFKGEVFFQNQKFHVSFQKRYDAESLLKLSKAVLPKDEQY